MKNIHLLQTDKASRVLYNSTLKSFCIQKEIDGMFINDGKVSGADFWGLEKALNNGFQPHNIYITSNEELVLGGYHFNSKYGDEPQKTNQRDIDSRKYWEEEGYYITKIILTTEQELIDGGVQAIDFIKEKYKEQFKNK